MIETTAKTLTCIAEPQGEEELKMGYAFRLGFSQKWPKE